MSTVATKLPGFLTVLEAAERIGISGARVRQMLLAGEMEGFKTGTSDFAQWLISEAEVAKIAAIPQVRGCPRGPRSNGE